jgi:hypothetical protein
MLFSAICHRRLAFSGSPVFGLTSKRGKLLLGCLDHVIAVSEAGFSYQLGNLTVARTEHAGGHARVLPRPKHQKPGGSWRFRWWEGFIIGTNVAPPESR